MRIMIVGVGGIGGLIGGKLMANTNAEVTLIARGAHLQAIREKGLTLIDNNEAVCCRPALATDKPEEAAEQDVIFLATKGYGLADAVRSIVPAVGNNTYIIPLLNGVDTSKRIRPILNKGVVCDGLIYVFSQIEEPGVIKRIGSLLQVYMGHSDNHPDGRLTELTALLTSAGVPACVPQNIRYEMWMKWSMMCASAQTAAYYHKTIGEMRDSNEARGFFAAIVSEVLEVAEKEGVALPKDLYRQLMQQVKTMPYESTPSIMRDLDEPGKPTELFLFGGALHDMAAQYGIRTPHNDMVLQKFGDRL
ncbi:MAG: 2-dehydropantoate 2-reductase [Eubacteriales bacterium]|nr:2-dehydropantoate 2-reductase [Eubacteriales bacterium]